MIAQQIVNGISLGMGYALLAVGYSMVFGILRLVDFSIGGVYAFGAVISLVFVSANFGIGPAILLSIVLTGLLEVIDNKFCLEPLRKKDSPPISSLITTIGISNIITNLLIVFVGSEKRSFPKIFNFSPITIGTTVITGKQIGMLVVSIAMMLILMFIVFKTKIGLAMRATEQNAKAANMNGINVNFIINITFLITGICASIAGSLIASYYSVVYPGMGNMTSLKAFAAAVLGGIGVLPGSIIGGMVVGVSESLAATFFGSSYRDSVAFIILIVVLIIRPNGILGKKGIMKV